MPTKRENNSYIEALKQWNKNNNPGRWCIPKKGSNEYDEIMKIKKDMEEKGKKKE